MHPFIQLFFVLFLTYTQLFSYADSPAEVYLQDEYYNFLLPSMAGLREDNPLYKLSNSPTAHRERFAYFQERKKQENIKAWKLFFKNKRSEYEIEEIFYKPNSIKKAYNAYQRHHKKSAFTKYLSFLYLQNNYAQQHEKKSDKRYDEVLKTGEKYLKKEHNPFLKERYLYLLMRLLHHHGAYQETLDIYQKYQHTLKKRTIVQEWIDALRAGAYRQLKAYVKANQLYAKIFKTHKTNPHYGYYDFKIDSDNTWKKLLKESPDNNETALYHFLRAMNWKNEALLEFEQISKIAPTSTWFQRLNYMLMQNFQNKRYKLISSNNKKNKDFQASLKSYKVQKKYFFKILNRIKTPSFFNLYSKLYLQTIEYIPLAKKDKKQLLLLANTKQKPYIKLLDYLNTLHQLGDLSDRAQKKLFKQLKPLLDKLPQTQQESLLRYTALQLAPLYPENGVEKDFNELYAKNKKLHRLKIFKKINFANPVKFQNYINKKDRRFLDRQIFKSHMKVLHSDDVAKILATLYLQSNDFDKARFYLRQAPIKNVYSPYNPFNATLSGNNRKKSKKSYSQREFAQTMFRIQEQLKKKPKSAKEHFLYATGLFNKSWFGNFPMSSVLYRSSSLHKGESLPKTADLNMAESEYSLALYLTKDEEFKAKIAYQLLKIRFHQALSNSYNYDKGLWSMPVMGSEHNGTQKVMKVLHQSKAFIHALEDFKFDYEDTKYGQEIINTCITFQYF